MNYHIIAFRVRDITNFGRGVILFFSLLYKKNASTDICKITNVKICTLFDSSSINLQILFLFYIRFNNLAISIAYSVAIRRNSVYFIKFNKLINILRNAYNEGTFERKVKQFFKYKLLIIDEVGFNEISPYT